MLDWSSPIQDFARPSAGHTTEATGLIFGTYIATELGWRPVEAIGVGDLVLTFDHGFQPVKEVKHDILWSGEGACQKAVQPVCIPKDLLGNDEASYVLPDQGIMVESDAAESHRGDPFAVIRAAELADFGLIDRVYPNGKLVAITLVFAEDEVIHGHGGINFYAPKPYNILSMDDPQDSYKILNDFETRVVLFEIWEQAR